MITHIESENSLTHQAGEVEYKLIPGCPGYRAGTDGTIWTCRRRKTWKQLKPCLDGTYFKVVIWGKTKYVHRLILETFVGPCPPGMWARHFPERDATNNRLSNLSWSTPSINNQDKLLHGTALLGERNHNSKLNSEKVMEIRKSYANGARQVDLSALYGVTHTLIWKIVNKRFWKHLV